MDGQTATDSSMQAFKLMINLVDTFQQTAIFSTRILLDATVRLLDSEKSKTFYQEIKKPKEIQIFQKIYFFVFCECFSSDI